ESDRDSADKAFRAGTARAGCDGEAHLVLRSIGDVLQDDAGARGLRETAIEAPASPGLTIGWLKAALVYQAGGINWEQLEATARLADADAMVVRSRMACAWFARGMKALAWGARDEALEAFWN